MGPTRERSPHGIDSKRLKTTNTPSPSTITSQTITSQFANEIFNHSHIAKLHADYLDSNPFKHVVIEKLFQDELLVKVTDECLKLGFTLKETDIFKVCDRFFSSLLLLNPFDRSNKRAILLP